jgi:hypothetical protein
LPLPRFCVSHCQKIRRNTTPVHTQAINDISPLKAIQREAVQKYRDSLRIACFYVRDFPEAGPCESATRAVQTVLQCVDGYRLRNCVIARKAREPERANRSSGIKNEFSALHAIVPGEG